MHFLGDLVKLRLAFVRCCPIVLILTLHSAIHIFQVTNSSPCLDEPSHLAATLAVIEEGAIDIYANNPPLVRYVVAASLMSPRSKLDWRYYDSNVYARCEFAIGARLFEEYGRVALSDLLAARHRMLIFSTIGIISVYLLGLWISGTSVAILSATLLASCPNYIAHNATLGTDGPGAAMVICSCMFVYLAFVNPQGVLRSCIAGAVVGLAVTTKLTWIILLPISAMSVYFFSNNSKTQTKIARSVLIVIFAVLFINLMYKFDGSLDACSSHKFKSDQLNRLMNACKVCLPPRFPLLLPKTMLLGIDIQAKEFEEGKWCYLLGVQKFRGWWYYYIVCLLVKTPAATVVLFFWAGFALVARRANLGRNAIVCVMFLAAFTTAIFVFISAQYGFTRYIRYIIGVVPLFYLLISVICWSMNSSRVFVFILVFLHVFESLFYAGSFISFFNIFSGGSINGPNILLDANIDWGQDLHRIDEWRRSFGGKKSLYVAYFGAVSPQYLGYDWEWPRSECDGVSKALLPAGYYAISLNLLYGYKHDKGDLDCFSFFRDDTPIGRAGHSVWIYEIHDE